MDSEENMSRESDSSVAN